MTPALKMLLADEIGIEEENLSFQVRHGYGLTSLACFGGIATPTPSQLTHSSSTLAPHGQILVLDPSAGDRIIGRATVNLWIMIEDSCSILRQVRAPPRANCCTSIPAQHSRIYPLHLLLLLCSAALLCRTAGSGCVQRARRRGGGRPYLTTPRYRQCCSGLQGPPPA